ncbi:MAG: PQQ-binding-like beta-propeller repeat protein [Candidatus Eremiobacteraeota bacterium]|nr:PQQ-binding-like beta-propeller repeat protein [Candidatus Eremiobacteraeota bacterium]
MKESFLTKSIAKPVALLGVALIAGWASGAGRADAQSTSSTNTTVAAAGSDSSNWVLPAFNYAGNRYLPTAQITTKNVAALKEAWTFKIDDDSPMETAPIAYNGMLYVTSAHDNIYALDAKTGQLKWKFSYAPHVIAFSANRGVAIQDGKVFVGTLDGHLIALDAMTGAKVWDVIGVHDQSNTFYTMSPIPYKGMLLEGASNGDWGGIGYVTAFDPKDGKRIWEWNTVPGPGEPGHDTWAGDSWKRGGAAVWSGVAIDPATDTLFMDLGNPQPDFLGTERKGTNLYSNSMVALDISGTQPKLKWYYQFIPHDTHDWDPAMPPVLFTGMVGGAQRQLVASGDKAGNFWVLDSTDGKLVYHVPVSTQKGQDTEPSVEGNLACPNTNGGVEYNGGSYMPETNTFYVPSVDECGIWKSSGRATYLAGQFFIGGTFPPLTGPNTGWMNAVDIGTGQFAWRKKLALPAVGGALSFGTGVVFTGELDGTFDAFDAKSGSVLWKYPTGSPILAPPSAYMVGDKQYIVVASGQPGNQTVPEIPKTSAAGSLISAFSL